MSEYKLRPYQIEAKEAVEKEWANGNKKTLLVMATGCHMKGEKLLMADGSIKAVEDITNNDFLMGDDGLPRTILKMHNGIDDIYKVTPSKGDPFYISSEHTLTLVDSKDNYIDVPLKEFLSWRKTKRNKYYLKRSNPIYNFLDHGSITKEDGINPYVLGILVNNSTIKEIKKSTSIRVALRPQKTKEFFEKWCNMHGLLIVKNIKNNDNDFSYYIKKDENTKENILVELAKKYGIVNVKCSESFIPDEIKYAPYDERIQFLAATIDLCGSCAGSGYQITKKSTKFTDDLIFLARSCGFSAYKHVSIKNAGKPNETSVNVIHIGGNFGIVPTLEKYNSNILALDVLKTKFEIVPFRKDEYFGFTVDGNNRYLLADFTISHNCGKTVVFSNIIKDAIEKNGHKVLVIAHREELLLQAKEKLESMTGLEVAIEKGQNKAYETNAKIIVASVQTIQGKNRLNKYDRNEFGTIVVDEAHHILANGYQKVMEYFDENANVLGVTATADRGDKRGLGIYFDSIAYEYGLAQAIQEGYLVPLKAMTIPLSLDISNVKTSQGDYQIGQLGNAIDPYLDEIAQKISNICKNMKTLVFLPTVETAKKMKEKLIKYGMKAEEIDGTTKNRADILKDFKNGDYNILANPILLTEGYDEPSTNCMVMLRPTQIRSLYTQAVGRISRLYPGKTEGLILDFLWLTERHNLIKPASLFSDDPEVIDIAAKKVDASAEPLDLMETTKKSRAEMVANRERSLKETLDAQRRKQAQYVDPLQFAVSVESEEILSYEAITRADKKKPTQEQIEWLFKHGINADEIKDYGQARNIIRSLKERYAKSLSTPKQIRFLEKRGFRRVGLWSFSAASALISEISENSWMIPRHIDPKTYVPKI